MTQLEIARKGKISPQMEQSAAYEKMPVEELRLLIECGHAVLPVNINTPTIVPHFKPRAIGEGLMTKVNANIGTSRDRANIDYELEKLASAIKAGTDAVMDLSTGGDIGEIRRRIRSRSPVMLGTVPIYEVVCRLLNEKREIGDLTSEELFSVIEQHGKDGVDFITVHCGVTQKSIEKIDQRLTGVVSRGGAFLVEWMRANGKDNPLFTEYDRLLDIARRYDMTLSLGDGLRPGSIADATDIPQVTELAILGDLCRRARRAGVQVMIEGPGHIPLHQVETNVSLQKAICDGAPFYVLGPIVTDIAPGYDHITSAIGGALAAWAGANFLCYVTPAEHLGLPTVEDVHLGVISARIAGHSADIARGLPGAEDWDREMSSARYGFDWNKQAELAIDPEIIHRVRERCPLEDKDTCSMCASLCAMKVMQRKKSK
jgi:phosphomethylpyrimidine synthase